MAIIFPVITLNSSKEWGLQPSNLGTRLVNYFMDKHFWILTFTFLLSACSAFQVEPPVALALDDPKQPFQSGVEIAKPTYTPVPTAIVTPPPPPSTAMPASVPTVDTATSAFSADTFVVIESQVPSAGDGYDSITQFDSPPTYDGSKFIQVDISEQHMYVYEADTLIYSFIASTGMGNSTRVGTFSVLNKIPNAYGATWNIWMPNWLGIYWSGSLQNGIHALPILSNGATLWAGYLGTPISYGCVVLDSYDAQVLYDWADIGTPVEIRW